VTDSNPPFLHGDRSGNNGLKGGNGSAGEPCHQAKIHSSPDFSPSSKTININELVPGSKLDANIFSQQGLLLLKAGSEITDRFIRRLRNQGLKTVKVLKPEGPEPGPIHMDLSKDDGEGESVHAHQAAASQDESIIAGRSVPVNNQPLHLDDCQMVQLETCESLRLDDVISESGFPELGRRGMRLGRTAKLNVRQLRELIHRFNLEMYDKSMGRYEFAIEQVLQGKHNVVEMLSELLNQLKRLVMADPGLPLLVMKFKSSNENEYLYSHGLNVAMLSMAIIYQLGMSGDEMVASGMSSLFQDVGMMKVPLAIRTTLRRLTSDEVLEIQRHPIYVLDFMEKSHMLNDVIRLICYQHHERYDRSGYPRRRHGMFIHPFARIIAVADTYTALTCHRPYRKVLSPYEAVLVLLNEVKQGRLDRMAVRAFLDCVSLFPVGSYVQLSDGSKAMVIRSNDTQHTRPVVVPLNSDGSETDVMLDLSKTDSCKVVSAAAA